MRRRAINDKPSISADNRGTTMRKQIIIAAVLAFSASTAIAQQQQAERAATPVLSAADRAEHEACVRKNETVQREAKKFCGANLACYQKKIKRGEDATKTCERAMRAGVARHLAGQ